MKVLRNMCQWKENSCEVHTILPDGEWSILLLLGFRGENCIVFCRLGFFGDKATAVSWNSFLSCSSYDKK
jgi:hypothetical protein